MQRATKIVATLGPASSDADVLKRMLAGGVDVVRLNFSHGTAADHQERARLVRETARALNCEVAIMADLQGPKIRVGKFVNDKVALKAGQSFILDADCELGNEERVGLDYKELPRDVAPGAVLLLDEGLIRLRVESVLGNAITTRVEVGGVLSNNKGINRQGGGLTAPALTAKDMDDMKTAVAIEADYLAVSFPKNKEDMYMARQLLRAAGGKALIIAKIERAEAITALEEIIEASDGIMVARGDLAVEVGNATVPGLQKRMIRLARERNKLTITATQMMESMIQNPVPTRAEVSDVANAVLDGTDAVMLSAETAAGRYPLKAVEAMAQVIEGAEKYQLNHPRARQRTVEGVFKGTEEAIAMAVMYTANHMKVRAIVALTESGETPLWMSRIRSDIPVYAFTRHEATRRRVTLYRGVYPVIFDVTGSVSVAQLYRALFSRLLELKLVELNDLVILTKGELSGVQGGTNSMQILKVVLD